MTDTSTSTCGSCGAPMTDAGTVCWDCIDSRDGLRDLLSKLTAHVIGAETPGGTPLKMVIHPGDCGRGKSTAWDTPRGEASNVPRMLREARGKQTRFAAEIGERRPGGDEPSLPVDHAAGSHLVRLERVMLRLVRDTMAATRTVPGGVTWGALARWLDGHVDVIRMQPWAPTILADLRRVVAGAERHVDRPPTRLYLGPCGELVPYQGDDGASATRCTGEYRALDSDTTARCTACDAEVDLATRKRQLLEDASDRWMTAPQVESLTVWLGFGRLADSTVDAWGKRGQVDRRHIPADGPWHYRLGDVLARLEAQQQKRRAS